MKETQTPQPLNVYAESKLAADRLAMNYMRTHDMTIIGLRYFNVYGPGEQHKGKAASMIWQLAKQIAIGKRPRVFKWGEQERDHIYVADVVKANLLAMNLESTGIINVGTGESVSFNDIINELNSALGATSEPEYFDNTYGFYQEKTVADMTRTRSLVGFRSNYRLPIGITDYLSKVRLPG